MHRKHSAYTNPTCALRAPFASHTFHLSFDLCRAKKVSSRSPNEHSLSPRKLHLLLEEKDLKSHSQKNSSFWTFAAHMTQIPPKKYNLPNLLLFFTFCLLK